MKDKKYRYQTQFQLRAASDNYQVEAYASVFGTPDSYGSIFVKGCFADSIQNNNIKVLWNHCDDEPIGKVLEAREDETGLYTKFQLVEGVEEADKVYKLIKAGVIDSMSIGFYIKKEEYKDQEWRILDVDLLEVSPVTFPANKGASILSVRKDDGQFQFLTVDELKQIQLSPEDLHQKPDDSGGLGAIRASLEGCLAASLFRGLRKKICH